MRNRFPRQGVPVVGSLLVAVLLLAGCSSGGSSSTPASGTTATKADLRSQLLVLADFPTGWATTPVDKDTNSKDDSGSTCSDVASTDPLSGTSEVRAAFKSSTASGPVPREFLEALASDPNGQEAFDKIEDHFNACHSYTDTSGGSAANITVSKLSFPAVGDQSAAWLLSERTSTVSITVPIVVARRGTTLAVFGMTDPGSDQTTFTTLVQRGVGKIG